MERVHREWAAKGLAVVAVNLQEDPATVAAWVRQVGLSFTVALDRTGEAAQAWRITATPTVFVVDRDGRLVGKVVGNRDWTGDAWRAALGALVRPDAAGR